MRCIAQVLLILHLVYETAHAPSGVCPSTSYCKPCDEKNVICTLSTLSSISNYLNVGQQYLPVTKLILNVCDDNIEDIGLNILNVKKLKLYCSDIGPFLSLFIKWEPHLETITTRTQIYQKLSITGNETCAKTCNPKTFQTLSNASFCVCVSKVEHYGDNNSTVNTTSVTPNLSINGNTSNSTGKKEVLVENNKYHFYFLLIIGSVSILALLVNFILLTSFCSTQEAKLIDVFGLALMVFNIFLSLYGVALAVYLSQEHKVWHQRFCQGFTSIKLFALGTSVWTLMMLTFHRSVRGDIEEEREAIFKGIVYILEGLMLSGVLAVMSWIKLDKWDYLCVIFEPKTHVEWLLSGIEMMYYFFTFLLLLQYPYHQIRKKKKTEGKKINKNHPIFLMVLVCFLFWGTGYVITLPYFGLFWDKLRRVIRVCAIIVPLVFQPIIYLIRNTCCCLCRDPPCSKKKQDGFSNNHSVLLVCECTGSETCPACEPEYEEQSINTQFYESEVNGGAQKRKNKKKSKEEKKKVKEEKKAKKKRKNDVFEPKSIERSPILKQRDISADDAIAETPLLELDVESNKEQVEESPKKSIKLTDDATTPLLDDTDGVIKQPPKATPDCTPKKISKQEKSNTDFPSFINMESAIDVEALPKEKTTAKIVKLEQMSSVDEEGRKSRGPTFFPLAEKSNTMEDKGKRKVKKKHDGDHNLKINNDSSVKRRKGGRKKQDVTENGKSKANPQNTDRNSTISLEWDHYSDSSGSMSRTSDCFSDDVAVVDNVVAQNKFAHQNNGISNNRPNDNTENLGDELELTSNTIKNNKNKQKAEFLSKNTNGRINPSSMNIS